MTCCCHTCARRPKCLAAKPNVAGRPVCTLVAGSQECKDTAASGWCRICKRWTQTLDKKGVKDDRPSLF